MGMPSSRGEEWQPLLLYRNSLVHGETDLPPQVILIFFPNLLFMLLIFFFYADC